MSGGLVDEQVLGFEQPQVRRDHVAGGQPHDVARHQRLDRNFGEIDRPRSGAAPHARRRLHHGAQRAAASLERCSWTKAVTTARTTMMTMTMAARTSPRK